MAVNNNILNELKGLNSPLADMPRNMPFELPENYFQGLPHQITSNAQDTVDTVGMPHIVPKGYFDSLPEKIINAVETRPEKPKSKRIQFAPARWMAAAILVIMFTVGGYTFLQPSGPDFQAQLSEIPQEDLLAYVEKNIEDFDPYLLEENITTITTTTKEIDINNLESYIEQEVW